MSFGVGGGERLMNWRTDTQTTELQESKRLIQNAGTMITFSKQISLGRILCHLATIPKQSIVLYLYKSYIDHFRANTSLLTDRNQCSLRAQAWNQTDWMETELDVRAIAYVTQTLAVTSQVLQHCDLYERGKPSV